MDTGDSGDAGQQGSPATSQVHRWTQAEAQRGHSSKVTQNQPRKHSTPAPAHVPCGKGSQRGDCAPQGTSGDASGVPTRGRGELVVPSGQRPGLLLNTHSAQNFPAPNVNSAATERGSVCPGSGSELRDLGLGVFIYKKWGC